MRVLRWHLSTALLIGGVHPLTAQDRSPLSGTVICHVEVARERTTCGGGGFDANHLPHSEHAFPRTAHWSVTSEAEQYHAADSTYRITLRIVPAGAQHLPQRSAGRRLPVQVFLVGEPEGHAGAAAERSGGAMGSRVRVTLRNPHGYRAFTGPHQAFRLHPMASADEKAARSTPWEFAVPPHVTGFEFVLGFHHPVQISDPVPLRAPDVIPARLLDRRHSIACTGILPDTCIPNVLKVLFEPAATGMERREALNAIDGWVVGGDSFVNLFYVQFLADRTPERLREVRERLNANPHVRHADPVSTAPVELGG
jgi:hypothetical protein